MLHPNQLLFFAYFTLFFLYSLDYLLFRINSRLALLSTDLSITLGELDTAKFRIARLTFNLSLHL